MKLKLLSGRFYRVKKGQTLYEIARTFCLPPRVLAAVNSLSSEPEEGNVLIIPPHAENLYLVKGGESQSLLCGTKENFFERNFTAFLYPTQIVLL